MLLLIPAVALALWPYLKIKKHRRRTRNRVVSMVLHIVILTLITSVFANFKVRMEDVLMKKDAILLVDVSDSTTVTKDKIDDYLEDIIKEYSLSNIASFNQIALTLKNWRKEIINSFDEYDGRRINNGPIEGRNKYIKILLSLANGYRNFKRFRNRVLYVFNKFEKPSDSPKETKFIKLSGIIRGKYNKK